MNEDSLRELLGKLVGSSKELAIAAFNDQKCKTEGCHYPVAIMIAFRMEGDDLEQLGCCKMCVPKLVDMLINIYNSEMEDAPHKTN